jgi:hypothetical protein
MGKIVPTNWYRRFQVRRAAKRYARLLAPHLLKAYGAAEHYTVPQVVTSVAKLGLDRQFLVLGCAAHLSEEAFLSIADQLPVYLPYEEARRLVAGFRQPNLSSASGSPEQGLPGGY